MDLLPVAAVVHTGKLSHWCTIVFVHSHYLAACYQQQMQSGTFTDAIAGHVTHSQPITRLAASFGGGWPHLSTGTTFI